MKKKQQQPSLFDQVSVSVEEQFWIEFQPVVRAMAKQGLRSICHDWWRSRYYESVICPNHAANKKGFEYQQQATNAWKFIWNNYRHQFNTLEPTNG